MASRIRFRRFYECDTESDRSLDFGQDSLLYCLDTQKYYRIYNSTYEEVLPDEVIFISPIPISKLSISGIPDGTKFLRDDGSWATPAGGGGGGGSSSQQTDYDSAITGARNGVNTLFTLSTNFVSGTTKVFVNGIRYSLGALNDYIETGTNQITFTNPPDSGDILVVDYLKP